jgi:TolB protein
MFRHFILSLICTIAVIAQAHAETPPPSTSSIYIKVGEASVKRSLMAMPAFRYLGIPSSSGKTAGADLFNIVYNDLNVSDYFAFIREEAFLEDPTKVGLEPAPGDTNGFHFENWQQIKVDFLVRAGYSVANGEITFETYVYYVPQAKLVFGKKYHAPLTALRKLAHTFANDVVEKLTGKKGYFLTKIVAASDRAGKEHKEIFVMDWDGTNIKQISDHKSITMSPSWAPDGKSVVYTAFAYNPVTKLRNVDLFRYDLDSGKRWLISFHHGINSGAMFIAGSDNLLATLSKEGNPDIYELTRDGDVVRQLTHGPGNAMNVEPTASPDGSQIAFSSDRGGRISIYVMKRDGSGANQRANVGRYNASPAWSPDGKKIAFAGQDKDHFDIFIMNADGSNIVRLTTAKKKNGRAADNEDPCFSPDGTRIMFVSNRTGTNAIYITNLDGSNERQITYDHANYFRPKWSPYLE